jgi:Ca2+/H+ antiporter
MEIITKECLPHMLWLKVMLLFVPISLAGHFLGASPALMFVLSCLAIVPPWRVPAAPSNGVNWLQASVPHASGGLTTPPLGNANRDDNGCHHSGCTNTMWT